MPCISATDLYDFSPRARRGFYQLQTRKVESLCRPSNRLQFSSLLHSSHEKERADDAEPFLTSKSFMCVRVCIKINHLPLPDCPTKKKHNLVSNPGAHIIWFVRARKESRKPPAHRSGDNFVTYLNYLLRPNVIFYGSEPSRQATYSIYHKRRRTLSPSHYRRQRVALLVIIISLIALCILFSK